MRTKEVGKWRVQLQKGATQASLQSTEEESVHHCSSPASWLMPAQSRGFSPITLQGPLEEWSPNSSPPGCLSTLGSEFPWMSDH